MDKKWGDAFDKEIDKFVKDAQAFFRYALRGSEILALAIFFQAASVATNSIVINALSNILYIAALVYLVCPPSYKIGQFVGKFLAAKWWQWVIGGVILVGASLISVRVVQDLREAVVKLVALGI